MGRLQTINERNEKNECTHFYPVYENNQSLQWPCKVCMQYASVQYTIYLTVTSDRYLNYNHREYNI